MFFLRSVVYVRCQTIHSIVDMSHRENKDRRTLYCGNLHENVTEEMLFELFLQVTIRCLMRDIDENFRVAHWKR